MARLAGVWRDATLEGDRELLVGGRVHRIPDGADVKIVFGSDGVQVAHVRLGRRVLVLSALGVLLETDLQAKRRAMERNWQDIAGS